MPEIVAVLVDAAGPLPPNPLLAAALVFPRIVHEPGSIDGKGVISPATEQPEIAGSIAPAHCGPSGTRNVGGIREELLGVDTVLVGDASWTAAGNPSPLGGKWIVFPQVVQRPSRGTSRGSADRILTESA